MTLVYTAGTFDLLHIGHVRIIRAARGFGDRLVVAVSTDELVEAYKGRKPVVPFDERLEMVRALRDVDAVVAQHDQDKFAAWERMRFDVWLVGDDWFGAPKYEEYRQRLEAVGVHCAFVPYTSGVSSTSRRHDAGASAS
ncbi:adenylyltransferase/cytidyltransferase family protein [uncultured Sphingomonas sp.]|uniref:adenylyltransferase/cytidyltransferase family protein n=1 Tax=uncultured Sphingomonas sp. TaxID=158754 RepID=UPI0035CA627C